MKSGFRDCQPEKHTHPVEKSHQKDPELMSRGVDDQCQASGIIHNKDGSKTFFLFRKIEIVFLLINKNVYSGDPFVI